MAVNILTGLIYGPLQYLDYIDDDETTDVGNLALIKIVKIICVIDMILRFFCGYVDEKNFSVSVWEKINFRRHVATREKASEEIMSLLENLIPADKINCASLGGLQPTFFSVNWTASWLSLNF